MSRLLIWGTHISLFYTSQKKKIVCIVILFIRYEMKKITIFFFRGLQGVRNIRARFFFIREKKGQLGPYFVDIL